MTDNRPWISKSSDGEFQKGMWDYAPDAKRTALGYAGIIATSYLLLRKGKKKKK